MLTKKKSKKIAIKIENHHT
jgi:hypothetical protein